MQVYNCIIYYKCYIADIKLHVGFKHLAINTINKLHHYQVQAI